MGSKSPAGKTACSADSTTRDKVAVDLAASFHLVLIKVRKIKCRKYKRASAYAFVELNLIISKHVFLFKF